MNAEPGWYHASGDPVGSTRYWDGARWIGEPTKPSGTGIQYRDGDRWVDDPTLLDTATTHRAPSLSSVPQKVHRVATGGERMAARVFDWAILIAIAVVVLWPMLAEGLDVIDAAGQRTSRTQTRAALQAVAASYPGRIWTFSGIWVLWEFVWVATCGGSPGKLMMGLRVARGDSGATPPGVARAALRSSNRLLSLVPVVAGLLWLLIGFISLVLLFADERRRSVMDVVASTVIIKNGANEKWSAQGR